MSNLEKTLSIIKPDAVERNLENEIKEMFKNNGFSILKEKKIQIEKSEAEKFYKVHETKPFDADVEALRGAGLTDLGIVQITHIVSDFGAYNRLNLALDTDYDYRSFWQQLAFPSSH